MRGHELRPISTNALRLPRGGGIESYRLLTVDLPDQATITESSRCESERNCTTLASAAQECTWRCANMDMIVHGSAEVAEKMPERPDRFDDMACLRSLLPHYVETMESIMIGCDLIPRIRRHVLRRCG